MTTRPEFAELTFERIGAVAVLTLNRPERLNAFTPRMARELVAALDATDSDDSVRAVVLTGAGRGFCAGADVSHGTEAFDAANPETAASRRDFGTVGGAPRGGGGFATLRMAQSRKPLIAAVNGPAVGAGASLTLPTDIRIAADSARFAFPFARRGVAPDAASSWFLPRVVGVAQAMEWVLTGRTFPAEEALRGRLVSQVVTSEALLPTALDIASQIAEQTSPVAVALARRLIWSMLSAPDPWFAHYRESVGMTRLGPGPDAKEGIASFLEKRPPQFGERVEDYLDVLPDWPVRPSDL